MRTRFLLIALFFLAVGVILAYGAPAVAQGADPVRVVPLSGTGVEQAHSVAFSPDGRQVAAGGSSGIYLLDSAQPAAPALIQTGSWARAVAFVPGTDRLAAGLFDGTVKMWSLPGKRLQRELRGPQGWVRSISFSRDGGLVAAASDDDAIRIWDTRQGSLVLTLDADIAGIRSVALSPDGSLVAGAMGDKTVRVWSVPDGKMRYVLSGHNDWVRCVLFSPDGRILASSGFDMTVRLWDMSTGQLLRTLEGHTSSVLGLAFSPDGTILASGSTDTTVRLWQVSNGAPLQLLRGHTGFVYSVAFSPDGKTLASGASDGTVRLWDVPAWLSMAAPPAANGPVESTTKDCRLCHHRQGAMAPPRVVELPCEGCHAGGIGQSWCIAFPRSSNAGPMNIVYHAVAQVSGVPTGGSELSVLLASPANGETLYVRGNFMAPEVISGRVYASDSVSVRDVEVRLDINAAGYPAQSLVAAPSADGSFRFNAAINPNASPPLLSKPGTRQCLVCHGDYQPQAGLPVGIVRLVVTATAPGGQRATDERWLRVDPSHDALLPVQAVDAGNGQPLPGLTVDASTVLYAWRDRFGHGTTGADGRAQLDLDALSQQITTYNLSIRPQVLNGILYSAQPVQVQIAPGASGAAEVRLQAAGQQGQVTGTLQGAEISKGLKVWAVQQPAGPAFEAPVIADNTFALDPLPVSRYTLSADVGQLAAQGLSAQPQDVDLARAPSTTVTLAANASRTLSGHITAQDGSAIPFAWITVDGAGPAHVADATSGGYVITSLPKDASFVTVSAPGYYAEARHIGPAQQSLDVRLTATPETRRVAWGSGSVVVTGPTPATVDGTRIELTRGWVWGEGGSDLLAVSLPGVEIAIPQGRFALEQVPGELGWLYLYDGNAQVTFDGQPPRSLKAGDMLALDASAQPFPMGQTAFLVLHANRAESPVGEAIQPTLKARVVNWLEKAGIGVAQSITFITYIISLVALFAIPVIGLFWFLRRRSRSNQ